MRLSSKAVDFFVVDEVVVYVVADLVDAIVDSTMLLMMWSSLMRLLPITVLAMLLLMSLLSKQSSSMS